jgi:hypothetical protein
MPSHLPISLVLTERVTPLPCLLAWDIARSGFWLVAPILLWELGMQVVSMVPAIAEEMTGCLIILDLVITVTVFLPRLRVALVRPCTWAIHGSIPGQSR